MVAQNKRYISTIYTVIRNGNFSAKTLFGDTMLGNTYAAYYWTSKTTRISEKIKKAKEGHKGQSKGQILM